MKKISACPSWLKLSEDRRSFIFVPEKAEVVREIFEMSISVAGARNGGADGTNKVRLPAAHQQSACGRVLSVQRMRRVRNWRMSHDTDMPACSGVIGSDTNTVIAPIVAPVEYDRFLSADKTTFIAGGNGHPTGGLQTAAPEQRS